MERKKHKRLNDTIMKPEDLKKAKVMHKLSSGPSSSNSSGGIKAKLDFRSTASLPTKPTINNSANLSAQSSHHVRPALDEKWKEFGELINFNIETFQKSVQEAIVANNFTKIAKMFVAALKSFMTGDKLKIELRIMGTMAETVKIHGSKLNHIPLHRGLLFVISNSRNYPENVLELFISIITSLACQQPMLDKCYLNAFLHDAIGMNVGLGTANRCSWIEKECSQELVRMILAPFSTKYPIPDMYTQCQVEGFAMAEFLNVFDAKFGKNANNRPRSNAHQKQLDVYVEFLKPWFDTVRGEVLPKSLFRSLCLLCGSEHIRFFIANRLEVWITLQKYHREISELFLAIGANINAEYYELDLEIIDILLKLNTKNMKTRTIVGPFMVAIKKICEVPKNVVTIMESLFVNETGPPQNRSPTNLQTIFMILNCQPVEATKALALITAKELFKEKENSVKMLRSFLRELVRGFYHSKSGEFPFSIFSKTIFKETLKLREIDDLPIMVSELVAQIPLVTISSLLVTRENAFATKYNTPSISGDFPLIPLEARVIREKFQAEFISYCESVIEFLSNAKHLFYNEQIFIKSYSLLLYLETQREMYTGMESAAVPEAEISNCIRIFGECGVSEKMLLLLCQEETTPLPQKSLVDLVSALTQRAALYHPKFTCSPLIQITEPFKLIDSFLKITIYPKSEVPRLDPLICNRSLYWTAWTSIVLWIAAGSDIILHFERIYEEYPILRYIVHCILIRKFHFPLNFEGKSSTLMEEEEEAAVTAEACVMNMYKKKMGRSVPQISFVFPNRNTFRAPLLLDEIRLFAEKFKLASRFSRCTSPPLLPRLISTVGAENSLFAIREMLSSDSTTVSMLTAESLFHSLLYYFASHRIRETDQNSSIVVKALVRQAESNLKSCEPIEQDFLLLSLVSALASPNISTRSAAVNTFSQLFPSSSEEEAFDLVKLSNVPRFNSKQLKYMELVANAVQVESDSYLAKSYLQFLTSNSMKNEQDHAVASAVCQTLSVSCFPLHSALCEYFAQYVLTCMENHLVKDLNSLDNSLCCVQFGQAKVALSREVPIALVKLLSRYNNVSVDNGMSDSFEYLLNLFLTPNAIPKMIDRDTGMSRHFLSLPMRKEMLKSPEQRVVDAALDELSESDAQEFVLVSQMSKETAEKVIKKAENMKIDKIDRQSLCNMYILIRGYRLQGVVSGECLVNRLKDKIEQLNSIAKEEPIDIDYVNVNDKPSEFLKGFGTIPGKSIFLNLEYDKMAPADITTFLKANCSVAATAKNKDSTTFRLPPAFIKSAMTDEKAALTCLQHIEANLKFFLTSETAFQTLTVIVDSAANKFDFVRKRLENFAARLLKSVSPPASVAGILQKHATNNSLAQQKAVKGPALRPSTFSGFAKAVRSTKTDCQVKQIVDEFMAIFVFDKGELIEAEDVLVFVRSIRAAYAGGDSETTAERALSNRWSSQLRKVVCTTILNKYYEQLCPVFVFRLISAYCKKYPLASYSEMFTVRDATQDNKFVPNKTAFESCSLYLCELASKTETYDLPIINLISDLEKEGDTRTGFHFGRAFLQASCANSKPILRKTAKRLLEALEDRLTYLSYKSGIASSIRVLTNIESREACIRRCEQVVDRIVEMPLDPKIALSEDICEEDRQAKNESKDAKSEEDVVQKFGGKRILDRDRKGGPPPKKGRFISAKDLPVPLGVQQVEEDSTPEEPVKREWIATSHAMTRFVSMLREHPKIVKMKFPVLANYVSKVTAMSRKELKDENRVGKIELILQSIVVLCQYMRPDEMGSVETALSNTLEFFEKHMEEGGFGIKEQTAFAELTIRACAEYLNHSYVEARTFLRDNRPVIDRVCKRCHDKYNVDLVLDNCEPVSI